MAKTLATWLTIFCVCLRVDTAKAGTDLAPTPPAKAPIGGVDDTTAVINAASPPANDMPAPIPADPCDPPAALVAAKCRCYGGERLQRIADGLTELKSCRAAVVEKDHLIQTRLVAVPTLADAPRIAWWQEPTMIVGGTVITIGVTAGLTAWLLSHR